MDGGAKAQAHTMNVVSLLVFWSHTIGNQSLLICKNQVRNFLNSAKMPILRGHFLSKHPPGWSFLGPGEQDCQGWFWPDPQLLYFGGVTLIYSVIRPVPISSEYSLDMPVCNDIHSVKHETKISSGRSKP